MPLVSATDIPLTPYPTGRTSPQAPSDYQQIPTSPQMFGSIGAEALTQAGQQGEKLATEIARIGAYQQHYLDRTEEDKLSSQLDDAAHQRKYGDPTAGLDANGNPLVPGFKNRYGSDAIDYIKSGQPSKDFNDDVARIAASASNDRVREMFLRQSRARRAAFDTSLDEHWTSQLAAYSDQVRKWTNIGIDRDLAVGYNDDQIVQNKIHDKIALYVRDEKDPVIAGGKYFLAVHDGAKQLIDAALADNNPTRAAEIFNAYKDHMSGSDQISLWNSIHPVLDNQTIAGAILGTSQKRPGGGAPLIPHTPTNDTLSGTGLTGDQYQAYRIYLAGREGNRYDLTPTPGHSRSGRYQFGSTEIAETAARLGVPVPTPQQFAADPKLQEQFLENYTLDHHNQLMASPAYRAASPDARAGMLAGAHLMGVSGVLRYVDSGGRDDPADANGTRVSSYVRGMQQTMGRPAAPVATPTPGPASGAAEGAPQIVAAGDSIGVGLNRENKLAGSSADDVKSPAAALSDAAGSRNPQQALDYARTHPERFAGKNVLWSTGLFNAGGPEKARAALAKVGEQIDALKEANAANIVLVGLDKGRFADLNAELAKVAADKGVQFAGPLPTDNIHPSKQGYRDYYASASKLFPGTAPGPRPSGMIEPGNIGPPT